MECPRCRATLEDNWVVCPECEARVSSSPTACPGCGQEVRPSWKICPHCEHRIRESTASEESRGDTSLFGGTLRPVADAGTRRPPPADPDRYFVESEIARGGMGIVYRARDTKLDRVVALKRLRLDQGETGRSARRFLSEGQAVAGLNHVNVVTVFDMGEDSEGLYIAMQYVDGASLESLLRERNGPLPEERAIALFRGICAGISYAHRKGVIHRDVKPANILVTRDDVPMIVDFGLARVGRQSSLSASGYGMGTLDYAAPEQKRDAKSVDHRADIYSLGCTLYALLTGHRPPPHPDEIPARREALIRRATRPEPEDRYFSVDEMVADLDLPGLPVAAVDYAVGEAQEGACASCGVVNDAASRYCRKCGEGLFTDCPSCEREVRVGVPHCDQCGCHVETVQQIKDRHATARRYEADRKLSRAVKEYRTLLETDAGARLGNAGTLVEDARKRLADVEERRNEARARWEAGEQLERDGCFEEAEPRLAEAERIDAGYADRLASWRDAAALKITARDEARRIDNARALVESHHLEEARTLLANRSGVPDVEEERLRLSQVIQHRLDDLADTVSRINACVSSGLIEECGTLVQQGGEALAKWSGATEVLAALRAALQAREEASRRWSAAESKEARGDLDGAEIEYRAAATLDPTLTDAYEAVREKIATKRADRQLDELRERARQFLTDRHYDAALEAIRKCSEILGYVTPVDAEILKESDMGLARRSATFDRITRALDAGDLVRARSLRDKELTEGEKRCFPQDSSKAKVLHRLAQAEAKATRRRATVAISILGLVLAALVAAYAYRSHRQKVGEDDWAYQTAVQGAQNAARPLGARIAALEAYLAGDTLRAHEDGARREMARIVAARRAFLRRQVDDLLVKQKVALAAEHWSESSALLDQARRLADEGQLDDLREVIAERTQIEAARHRDANARDAALAEYRELLTEGQRLLACEDWPAAVDKFQAAQRKAPAAQDDGQEASHGLGEALKQGSSLASEARAAAEGRRQSALSAGAALQATDLLRQASEHVTAAESAFKAEDHVAARREWARAGQLFEEAETRARLVRNVQTLRDELARALRPIDMRSMEKWGGGDWSYIRAALEQAKAEPADPAPLVAKLDRAKSLVPIVEKRCRFGASTTAVRIATLSHRAVTENWRQGAERIEVELWTGDRLETMTIAERSLSGDEKPRLAPVLLTWSPEGALLAACYLDGGKPTAVLVDPVARKTTAIGPAYRVDWVSPVHVLLSRDEEFEHDGSAGKFKQPGHATHVLSVPPGTEKAAEEFRCSWHDMPLISDSGNHAVELCWWRAGPAGMSKLLSPGAYFDWFKTDQLTGYPRLYRLPTLDREILFSACSTLCSGIVYPGGRNGGFSLSDRYLALPVYRTEVRSAEGGGKYGDWVRELRSITVWEYLVDRWQQLKVLPVDRLQKPTSIEKIIWENGDAALLVAHSHTDGSRVSQVIERIPLDGSPPQVLITGGRDPQWIGATDSFLYTRPGPSVENSVEVRAHQITTGIDLPLRSGDWPDAQLAFFAPGPASRLAVTATARRQQGEAAIRQRMEQERIAYAKAHPARLKVVFIFTQSLFCSFSQHNLSLEVDGKRYEKSGWLRDPNFPGTSYRVTYFDDSLVTGKHEIVLLNDRAPKRQVSLDLAPDASYTLSVYPKDGSTDYHLSKD